jgi:hypothetical protein
MEERSNVMPEKDVSVVTLTWNSEKDIEKFLESLIIDFESSQINYEIIIIDNGSIDKTKENIKKINEKNGNIILIELGHNTGTTFSRNIGLRLAKGKYIYILDSDTESPKGATEKLINAFTEIKSDKIGIIHPQLVYPNGDFQESARKFPSFKSKLFRLLDSENRRKKVESYEKVLNKEITKVDYAISAAWLFKKELLDNIGLLDENIFYAPEDAEFCARSWKNGYEVWFYPKVKIIHDCKRITKKKPFSKMGLKHIKGLIYFWKKYKKEGLL